jgi:release factor glutamine methyltransferase
VTAPALALRANDEPGLTGFARGTDARVMVYPPGVYRAETDTELLAGVMRRGDYARDRYVLDVGTGGGALAVAAAQAGARSVTAVDLSRRSVAAAWVNSRLARARVHVRRGDLFDPVAGRRFGLVVSNPPYVPAATDALPRYRKARCWDAGPDGRALLDRICAGVADVLTPDGAVLLVHSAVCDTECTLAALQRAGLAARELARITVPFGPVMHSRASLLEARGFVSRGQRSEELVVVEGRRDSWEPA